MIFTSYTDKGSRSSNQDAFFESESLYIVCDGVGGVSYGDVAAKLACSSFSEYFNANPAESYNSDYLNKALQFTIEKFKETVSKYPETKDMCTTVVLMAFDADGAIVSWMGDSRLYHLRDGKILFATEDHSLINEMKMKGEDTTNVSRNFITKALGANRSQELSFHGIAKQDIQSGDYFFLCTDGVLENVSDEILTDILSGQTTQSRQTTIEQKAEKIRELCEGKTRDNFTFILIQH